MSPPKPDGYLNTKSHHPLPLTSHKSWYNNLSRDSLIESRPFYIAAGGGYSSNLPSLPQTQSFIHFPLKQTPNQNPKP